MYIYIYIYIYTYKSKCISLVTVARGAPSKAAGGVHHVEDADPR